MKTLLFAGILCAAASPLVAMDIVPPTIEPWSIDESEINISLHVDTENAGDHQAADGSKARPFATIQEAIDSAKRSGEGVRILVHPGIYRETLEIGHRKGMPLVIESTEFGEAILSGSDVFSGWEAVPDREGVYRVGWTLKFGLEKNPWPGLMNIEGGGFRRELLFIDGKPLRQVMTSEQLEPGTYFVDETAGEILLHAAEGQDVEKAKIEISVRPVETRGADSKMIRIASAENIVLRGLVIQHAASPLFDSPAVMVLGSRNILIEDCEIRWNNGYGLGFSPTQGTSALNVTLRKVKMNDNGTIGLTGGFANGLIEDCETNRNNWRGWRWGATGWAPCGFKLSGVNGLHMLRHQANENYASGAWFDHKNTNILVDGLVAVNNYRSGLSIEADKGPMVVQNSVFLGNSVGVAAFDASNVALIDNVIAANFQKQLRIAGSTTMEESELKDIKQDWRRERLRDRRIPEGWTLKNNVIAAFGEQGDSVLVALEMPREGHVTEIDGQPALQATIETLEASGNTWFHPSGEQAKVFTDASLDKIALEDWQTLTGSSGEWSSEAAEEALVRVEKANAAVPSGFPHGKLSDDQLGQ